MARRKDYISFSLLLPIILEEISACVLHLLRNVAPVSASFFVLASAVHSLPSVPETETIDDRQQTRRAMERVVP